MCDSTVITFMAPDDRVITLPRLVPVTDLYEIAGICYDVQLITTAISYGGCVTLYIKLRQ